LRWSLVVAALVLALAGGQASKATSDIVVAGQQLREPNDVLWKGQWGLRVIGLAPVLADSESSPEVVVAVIDTGVDASHPDLQGVVLDGYDFVNGDADASDDHGHGTAAAGVIAARTNNGEGQVGVCGSCRILPVKVLDARLKGATSVLAQGIVWATDHGARVISMSLGGPATTQTLRDAVSYATSRGVVLVGAAGNGGTAEPLYPAAFPDVISVTGTTANDTLYTWSNRGATVDVAAPGCNTAPWLGRRYLSFCGTSSAAPLVAGLAGIAIARAPGVSGAEVARAIESTGVAIGDAIRRGRVRAPSMLTALGALQARRATVAPD
jgi:subtilisin family serine protease